MLVSYPILHSDDALAVCCEQRALMRLSGEPMSCHDVPSLVFCPGDLGMQCVKPLLHSDR